MNLITKQIEKAKKDTEKLKEKRYKQATERIDNILKENGLAAGFVIDANSYKQFGDMLMAGNKIITVKYKLWEDS